MHAFIEVRVTKSEISFIDHGGYESRSESTIQLFIEAFDQIQDEDNLLDNNFYVSTDDVSSNINNSLTFGYTNSNGVVLCPDFTFDKYVECGINSYHETVKKIVAKGNRKHSIDKLFWTGNLATQPLRSKLLQIGNLHTDKMEIIPMDWKRLSQRGSMHGFTNYTSFEDHAKYKYLIDCGAQGYSGRLKFLLHSNRPLFLVDRDKNKQEFFHHQLVPFTHFIPVKGDLSDLIQQLEWAEDNYDKAIAIANNAREFAINNLNKKAVIKYLSDALVRTLQ